MCDFSGNLIAWLDHELPEGQAAEVQRHVYRCTECQDRVKVYGQVTKKVSAYCDEALAVREHRGAVRWELALSAATVVGIALLLLFPRARIQPTPAQNLTAAALQVHNAAAAAPPPITFETMAAPAKKMRRRRTVVSAPIQKMNWAPADPAIQIAIPAEGMFPPGAIPEGINFVAELSIAPDGSAQRLRLQPRLVKLEGRLTQP